MSDTLKYIYQLILNKFYYSFKREELYEKVNELTENNQFRLALYVIKKILKKESNAELLYHKGTLELKLSKYIDAIETFEEAKNSFEPDEDRTLYI